MRRVALGEELYAIVVTQDDFVPGINFVSSEHWPFQLGLLMHESGHSIAPHLHLQQPNRVICDTQELLFVVSGAMEVDYYDGGGDKFHTEVLTDGEALLHIKGGHGFRFRECTRVLELKQGPYVGKEREKQMIKAAPTCR